MIQSRSLKWSSPKILFDTNIWCSLKKSERTEIEKILGQIKLFDSPVNIFEIVHHYYKEIKKQPKRILQILKEIAKLTNWNMLPSPQTVVIRRICQHIGQLRDDRDLEEELKGYYSIRKRIIEDPNWVESKDFERGFIEPIRQVRQGYVDDISELKKEFLKKFNHNGFEAIRNSKEYKTELFLALMERFKVPDSLKCSIALSDEWLKIDVLQISFLHYTEYLRRCLIDNKTPEGSDFFDLEFAIYIPMIDIFVTDNKRHFLVPGEIKGRILKWNEFKKEVGL